LRSVWAETRKLVNKIAPSSLTVDCDASASFGIQTALYKLGLHSQRLSKKSNNLNGYSRFIFSFCALEHFSFDFFSDGKTF